MPLRRFATHVLSALAISAACLCAAQLFAAAAEPEAGPALDTLARYSFEQGLSVRRVSVDEMFAKSTYELTKI